MTAPAPSLEERLRALGPARARALLAGIEAEFGPAGVAGLAFEPRFYLRPEQAPRGPYRTIEVFTGERRVGKSHAARELFRKLLPRAARARIMVAVDDAVAVTVYGGESGFRPGGDSASDRAKQRQWTPPWVRCEHIRDKLAGTILLGDQQIVCCSAAAPAGAVGPGWGLTWADDPAAWVKVLGARRARNAWVDMLKSNSARPGVTVVATTGSGVDFIWNLLHEAHIAEDAVRIHNLGNVENNAANLAENYITHIVPGLRAEGSWEEDADPTGAFSEIDWPALVVRAAPALEEIVVSVDPAKTGSKHGRSCEVGIIGEGIDRRGTVYGLADASAVLGVDEWPKRVWDLAEKLQDEFPGAPIHILVEINTGKDAAELLRQEGKLRAAAKGGRPVCPLEVREVTSRPGDSKTVRARPVVAAAKNGQVRMLPGLGVLCKQLSDLNDASPGNDRADAFVHGARDLAGWSDEKDARKEREEARAAERNRQALRGLKEAQARQPAPAWGPDRTAAEPDEPGEWDRV